MKLGKYRNLALVVGNFRRNGMFSCVELSLGSVRNTVDLPASSSSCWISFDPLHPYCPPHPTPQTTTNTTSVSVSSFFWFLFVFRLHI